MANSPTSLWWDHESFHFQWLTVTPRPSLPAHTYTNTHIQSLGRAIIAQWSRGLKVTMWERQKWGRIIKRDAIGPAKFYLFAFSRRHALRHGPLPQDDSVAHAVALPFSCSHSLSPKSPPRHRSLWGAIETRENRPTSNLLEGACSAALYIPLQRAFYLSVSLRDDNYQNYTCHCLRECSAT